VKDPSAPAALFPDRGRYFRAGQPTVDDSGKAELIGQAELIPEGPFLFFGSGEVIVEIQADFAQGGDRSP
jgi:hypothetical protein